MSCHKPRLPCRVCVHVFRFPVIVPRVGVRTRVAKGACVGLSVSSSVVCALVSGCQAGIRVSGGGCVWGFRWYGDGPGRVWILSGPSCYVLVRRRATLPHPVGCSTIAVPGLRFRVRNGSGRLPWAMAAANL